MTLTEKVNLTTGVGYVHVPLFLVDFLLDELKSYRWELERCVGQNGAVPRLGIPSMCMQDSPVGVRDSKIPLSAMSIYLY
jgi:beta-glucosidase